MKTPKTESSVRKVFLPRSVAEELIAWKAQQEEIKDILQEEYQDYALSLLLNMDFQGSVRISEIP